MYAKDHLPPHFHAIYNDEEAQIEIATGQILNGDLNKRALKLVQEWVEMHKE